MARGGVGGHAHASAHPKNAPASSSLASSPSLSHVSVKPPAPVQPSKTYAQAVGLGTADEAATPLTSAAPSPVTPAARVPASKVTVEVPAAAAVPAAPAAPGLAAPPSLALATPPSPALAPTVPSSPVSAAFPEVGVAPPPVAAAPALPFPTLAHARPVQWARDARRVLLVGEAAVGELAGQRRRGWRVWAERALMLIGLELLATAITTIFVFVAAATQAAGLRG